MKSPLEDGRLARSASFADPAVKAALADWRAGDKVRRLWRGDATLWTGGEEARWLGWLRIVEEMRGQAAALRRLADDARGAGFRHALVLGMGGSSLCPEVLRATFGALPDRPDLIVLDSTVPAQVRSFAARIDPARTLFVVSSKSGSTVEPNVFKQFFFELVRSTGIAPGERFVAVTDPGTKLDALARAEGFRHVLPGVPSIGGRYSALSSFGMAPAAVMGLDVDAFLARAARMVQACGPETPPEKNPGVALGVLLATLAQQGRDKLCFALSPGIAALGAWLEQLVAESTGKHGKGLVPVDGERIAAPERYGADRVFVQLRLEKDPAREQDAALEALERAGHPVVRIALDDPMALGEEFFRFELATAVAGAILGIDPFDQPDVEASKVETRKLVSAYEESGALPGELPALEDAGLRLFADPRNASALRRAGGDAASWLAAHFARLRPGDYAAFNAYVEMCPEHHEELQALRHAVRDARRVATTLGYGPRFLHSTGQLHKGGPNRGVFLQITADDAEDLAIPGQRYGFGVLARAQALGDFEVLAARERRALRVHLGPDVKAGLAALRGLVERAVG